MHAFTHACIHTYKYTYPSHNTAQKLHRAQEASAYGLVSRVVAPEQLVDTAVATAAKIASFSKPIIAMAKEAVNASYNLTLDQGILFERRLFHASFGTADQKEGMKAFTEKRKPAFTDK
jgi:enoyl-CoA hydratase